MVPINPNAWVRPALQRLRYVVAANFPNLSVNIDTAEDGAPYLVVEMENWVTVMVTPEQAAGRFAVLYSDAAGHLRTFPDLTEEAAGGLVLEYIH